MPVALPPSVFLRRPPFGAAPAATPSASPGAAVAAMSQVRKAIEILQMALPNLPIGSPPHDAVMNSIKTLSKHVPASSTDQGIGQATLADLAQHQQQVAPMMQLMRSMQAGGQPAAGGAPMQSAA